MKEKLRQRGPSREKGEKKRGRRADAESNRWQRGVRGKKKGELLLLSLTYHQGKKSLKRSIT